MVSSGRYFSATRIYCSRKNIFINHVQARKGWSFFGEYCFQPRIYPRQCDQFGLRSSFPWKRDRFRSHLGGRWLSTSHRSNHTRVRTRIFFQLYGCRTFTQCKQTSHSCWGTRSQWLQPFPYLCEYEIAGFGIARFSHGSYRHSLYSHIAFHGYVQSIFASSHGLISSELQSYSSRMSLQLVPLWMLQQTS